MEELKPAIRHLRSAREQPQHIVEGPLDKPLKDTGSHNYHHGERQPKRNVGNVRLIQATSIQR